jgi:hypothetical protein
MSLKPQKHSEAKTAQSTARRLLSSWDSGRKSAPSRHINPERHLIVTEGTKTEPLYFEAIRKRINDQYHGAWITVEILGAGMNTLSLMELAMSSASNNINIYSHVWLVYDKDSFSANNFNAVALFCKNHSEVETEYHAIWSNESFELWYLLHFQYLQSALRRDMYTKKLTVHLRERNKGRYTKSRPDMFQILESRIDTAINNASKLEVANSGKTPDDSNPGTMMHKLIMHLKPYMSVLTDNLSQVERAAKL